MYSFQLSDLYMFSSIFSLSLKGITGISSSTKCVSVQKLLMAYDLHHHT